MASPNLSMMYVRSMAVSIGAAGGGSGRRASAGRRAPGWPGPRRPHCAAAGRPPARGRRAPTAASARPTPRTALSAGGRRATMLGLDQARPPRALAMPRPVLIADDEHDLNDSLANRVQARGFEPVQIYSG